MELKDNFRNIKAIYKIEKTIHKKPNLTVKQAKNRITGEKFAVKILTKKKMSDEERE
jgi:hypothetical protein